MAAGTTYLDPVKKKIRSLQEQADDETTEYRDYSRSSSPSAQRGNLWAYDNDLSNLSAAFSHQEVCNVKKITLKLF